MHEAGSCSASPFFGLFPRPAAASEQDTQPLPSSFDEGKGHSARVETPPRGPQGASAEAGAQPTPC